MEGTSPAGEITYERPADEPASISVAVALAEHAGERATDPSITLYDHINPEALDALFMDTHGGSHRPSGVVEFRVGDRVVSVEQSFVRVRQCESGTCPSRG